MNLIRTTRTYATATNAEKALVKAGIDLTKDRWLVAIAPDGRFAPVVVGAQYIPLIHLGVTVVG